MDLPDMADTNRGIKMSISSEDFRDMSKNSNGDIANLMSKVENKDDVLRLISYILGFLSSQSDTVADIVNSSNANGEIVEEVKSVYDDIAARLTKIERKLEDRII
tara:strand:- start:118 stop:432 length:315 start_codon:yes stop_codon:yes gene_type:complete